MRFKVEIQINERVITKVFFSDNLEILEQQVKKDFPKGKIISIIGG